MSLSVFHQSNYEVVRYYMLTFNEWHPTKNKELTPEGFTHGSEKEVWWLRPKGHGYDLRIDSRTGRHRQGCLYCSSQKTLNLDLFK